MKKAIILLAGGIDSTTTLALAKQEGYDCYTLTFDYGQRHRAEIVAAQTIAETFDVIEHRVMVLDLSLFTTSALTNTTLQVPEYTAEKITPSYVPARNTLFLSVALGWAETMGATNIFYGGCHADHAGFPDCRKDYIEAFEKMANLATQMGVEGQHIRIHAPLLHKTKAQTLLLGKNLNVDYRMTVTCYAADPAGQACGHCESCGTRKAGFLEAGLLDITVYQGA